MSEPQCVQADDATQYWAVQQAAIGSAVPLPGQSLNWQAGDYLLYKIDPHDGSMSDLLGVCKEADFATKYQAATAPAPQQQEAPPPA